MKLGACFIGFWAGAAALASCGGDEGGSNRGGAGSGGGPGFVVGGQQCQSAADCPNGQVCHPISHTCAASSGSCETHTDCGATTYCDSASETCLPGTTGSPCATNANCSEGTCAGSVCGCSGLAHAQETMGGPLDIYLIFDRTASMGEDCAYQPGGTPPTNSKACFATYSLPDYLINVTPAVDTRLAFQFMSQENDCNGVPYETPMVDLTPLPVAANHAIVQAISAENFAGGLGTHIEGALLGLAAWTPSHVTPGREMIGVLMTDGDPNGCEEDIPTLRRIIADHLAATGIRTFVIGMEGATDANLEELASAGGAVPHDDWCASVGPPCHYWNVGDGSGDAIASALQAILRQATPLPCEFGVVGLTPPPGETLDFNKVNVTFTDPNGVTATVPQVAGEPACTNELAWYYDNPAAPATIHLCQSACDVVTASAGGSRVNVVVGCQGTIRIIR